jgi:multiple sugar transport system permease protein
MYNAEFGIVNSALSMLHLPTARWLTNRHLVKPAIIVMLVWKTFGYNMVLYLAALQSVPQQYYDAAAVDGVNWSRRFWHITLPMVSPTTFFIVVISVIQSFQVFGAVFIMTKGGPSGASTPLVYYIYDYGFQRFRMGYASSIAWVLFTLTACFTWIQWRYGERRIHYA